MPRSHCATPSKTAFSVRQRLIHRRRTRQVHGFDYVLECYLKASDRQYGYFCLPILFADQFVGRADCKAHRAQGLFEVKHLSLEHPPRDMAQFRDALRVELKRLADWHNCQNISITLTTPRGMRLDICEGESPWNTHIPNT